MSTDKDYQNFHLIGINIPAELLYNPILSHTDRLLFGFITNLSQGVPCTGSNKYLSKLLHVGGQTISNSINTLKENLYINVEFDDPKIGKGRKITVNPDYIRTYKPLMILYYENYRKNEPEDLLKKLYALIKKIIGGYKKINSKYLLINNSSKEEFILDNKSSSKEKDKEPKAPSSVSPDNEPSSSKNEFIKVTKRRTLTEPIIPKPTRQQISESLSKLANPPKKEKPITKPTYSSQLVIDYWIDKGLKISYASYSMKAVNEATKQYSVEDIKVSIDKFFIASTDPMFEPIDKSKLKTKSLSEFIKQYKADKSTYSLMEQFMKSELKPLIREDKFPTLTAAIKSRYQKEVIGNANVKFTNKDEDQFRLAAIKVQKFWDDNSNTIRSCFNHGPRDKARLLIDAVKENLNGKSSMITPGWLCTEFTINQRLPAYLNSQGVMEMNRESEGTNMNEYNSNVERQSRLNSDPDEIDYYAAQSADITF